MEQNIKYLQSVGQKKIVPAISFVFLLHIFAMESAYSGFVNYERPFLVLICCCALLMLLQSVLFCRTVRISISRPDIYTVGFLVILTLSCFYGDGSSGRDLMIIWCPGIVYMLFQRTFYAAEENYIIFFLTALLLVSICYIFNLHPLSFLSAMHLRTPINTGLNANFFAPIIPFAIGIYAGAGDYRYKLFARTASIAAGMLCIYVILQSNARLAYISILCGLACTSYHILLNARQRHLVRLKRTWMPAAALGLILLYCLYDINPQSVHGRFLIFRIGFNVFLDHPFLGAGLGGFSSVYNNYQAAFFHSKDIPVEIQFLAADTFQPFNELLRILVELGLIGAVFFGLFFYRIISLIPRARPFSKLQYGAFGALVSILVTCLLSYPLSISSIIINALFFLAVLTSGREPWAMKKEFNNPIKKIFCFLPAITAAALLLNREYNIVDSYRNWEKAALYSLEGRSAMADNLYRAEFPFLKNNGKFLLNYGSELIILGKNKEGLECLESAKNKVPSTALYLYLGNGYQNEGHYGKAESAYQTASDIAPSRFLPKYKLLNLHLLARDTASALKIAQEIIDYPVKIPSETVVEIKDFAKSVIKMK